MKVVFVSVKTDINGKSVSGIPATDGKDFFKQCLNQALITPSIYEEKIDCTSSMFGLINTFRDRFCSKDSKGKYYLDDEKYLIKGSNPKQYSKDWSMMLRTYLEGELKNQFGDRYKDHYTVFFIGEKCGGLNGFSYFNSTFGVYFAGHNKATLAHELFHAMNLPHTFDGLSAQAKYTYEAYKTNNIMDYSHHVGIERIALFFWQWQLLNGLIK